MLQDLMKIQECLTNVCRMLNIYTKLYMTCLQTHSDTLLPFKAEKVELQQIVKDGGYSI